MEILRLLLLLGNGRPQMLTEQILLIPADIKTTAKIMTIGVIKFLNLIIANAQNLVLKTFGVPKRFIKTILTKAFTKV